MYIKLSDISLVTKFSPEVKSKRRFVKASDIYSFGLLMWEISSGEHLTSEYEISRKPIRLISWDELNNVSKIDEGNFGIIRKAYWTKIRACVICKELTNIKDIKCNQYTAFIHELTIHIRIGGLCENIVRFLGVSKDKINNRYYLIMEYANDGDLRKFLQTRTRLGWDQIFKLAYQITNGLCYLHSEDIIHRDLHDRNIVVHNGNAKITDFGNAKSVNTQTNIHNDLFGMIAFLAPELLNRPINYNDDIPYSKKTDIYSLGMLFWELTSGCQPFKNYPCHILLYNDIIRGFREKIIPETPKEYSNLYIKCWNAKPDERPCIENVHEELERLMKNSIEVYYNDSGIITSSNSGIITSSNSGIITFSNSDIINLTIKDTSSNSGIITFSNSDIINLAIKDKS
ncbi:5212_t:CDS:2 [Cetraspora pellucida]|uniref:5212_t:CDS:1 n=1 Tax=Cetraspora pellucida TaxID=1433469 RepID=A0A9N8W9W7_9GLOM|nr:5212_t:CDS:2 [Cetraspora pellucida]